ncbi:hypothetical protein VNO77_41518 [Canavalia gladiata]|uniref:Uncharacterized protein n=1 Tax=Canavalia gladiata TaxID=3824 RepID=A0AAN9PS40_CANGL
MNNIAPNSASFIVVVSPDRIPRFSTHKCDHIRLGRDDIMELQCMVPLQLPRQLGKRIPGGSSPSKSVTTAFIYMLTDIEGNNPSELHNRTSRPSHVSRSSLSKLSQAGRYRAKPCKLPQVANWPLCF